MTIKKEKIYMLEYINWRAPERYISTYAEHEMDHLHGQVVLLGVLEIDVDYPEVDTRQAQIDALEIQVEKVRAESQAKINSLVEQIGKLKAVGHEG